MYLPADTGNINVPSVGDEIRTVRKARGMTLKQLSSHTECSVAYLSRIERDEARLSIELLTKNKCDIGC